MPDSGIPLEVVDAARERVKENRKPSTAGRRFWELSGGIIYCGGCGRRMGHHSLMARSKKYHYDYRCPPIISTSTIARKIRTCGQMR